MLRTFFAYIFRDFVFPRKSAKSATTPRRSRCETTLLRDYSSMVTWLTKSFRHSTIWPRLNRYIHARHLKWPSYFAPKAHIGSIWTHECKLFPVHLKYLLKIEGGVVCSLFIPYRHSNCSSIVICCDRFKSQYCDLSWPNRTNYTMS